ncbi:DUF4238 domain-containing protein [Pseudomonas monteilii]|uniref:DUF4238 domain-containing protein n=1 Tax=Pseudomonas monteilii TaxID=76759 RepID=UPI0018A8887C|nr:DUF4238 domain-containing protein [Pseudomonas monteilii]MBF8747638.1 DUF4238 domain-containing protein [Pseudomonas monteilii]
MNSTQQKKRHHFVPKAYLKAFTNQRGQVFVYRKDNPGRALPAKPDTTQFERYYYSQPLPAGGQDNNTLEDIFSEVESAWPALVERLARKESINDDIEPFIQFVALQRARVPAARDAFEAGLAATVKDTVKALVRNGKLPPPPQGFEDILDKVEVSIDPHQSIHAMPGLIKKIGELFDTVGFAIIHNTSALPFLTSDNPVVWYDPSIPIESQNPYTISPGGPIAIQFPISPNMMLFGTKEYREVYCTQGLLHGDIPDVEWVHYVNTQTCRFGYLAVIAQSLGQEEIIQTHSALSPVFDRSLLEIGTQTLSIGRFVFGSRVAKPKWIAFEDDSV